MRELNRRIRNLWVQALMGSGAAYRKLGILFLKGKACKKDRKLALLCLDKAAEMGDEQGYLLYHQMFSRRKSIIDAKSYREMYRDYQATKSQKEKKRLKRYLEMEKGGIGRL